MRKIILAVLLVALMALAITGCKEDAAGKEEVSRPAPGSAAAPSASAADNCVFGTLDGCEEGDNICMWDRCWSEQELFDRFSECGYTDGSAAECEAWDCEYCTSGKHSCYSTGSPRGSLDFCAECVMDGHCIEGMTCENGICVGSPSAPASEPEPADVLVPGDDLSDTRIVGKWKWFNGASYELTEDGKIFSLFDGSEYGFWEFKEGDTFILTWDNGKYIDTLTLSEDGNGLLGKNQNNYDVSGTRISE